ncbi:MAG: response regulator transcription factor [Bdellovibrio bacteriovorus]
MPEEQTVFVVDDDAAMRASMALMLDQAGFRVRAFANAQSFLESCAADDGGCLVLDLRMPDMSGLDLQGVLNRRGYTLPIIFLSAFGDVPTTVRAIQGGAVDFLEKPVSMQVLIGRIRHSLEEDRRRRVAAAEAQRVRGLLQQLTPREREVMELATKGMANKEIAATLMISPRTVENHRARLMEKLGAGNIAELCQVAALGKG